MSDDPQQLPKRSGGKVEVRHRAGTGASSRKGVEGMQMERIRQDRRKEPDQAAGRSGDTPEGVPGFRGFLLAAGGVSILVVGAAVWFFAIRPSGGGENRALIPMRAPTVEVEVSRFMSESSAEEIAQSVEDTLRGFMESKTDEERCRWVSGDDSLVEVMAEFYAREDETPPEGFGEITGSSPLPFGGIPMQVVVVSEREDDEKRSPYNVFPGTDRMLIDWESSVAYGELSWDQFLKTHPTTAVQMRVYLGWDGYYNYEFADDKKYQSIQIRSRGSEEVAYGFVERGTEVERQLRGWIPSEGMLPANVRLRFLPGSGPHKMVLIEELLHAYWVDIESLEERFPVK